MSEDRNKQWFVRGHVIVAETKAPIPGLCVRVWDKDFLFDDALGESVTDHEGRFFVGFQTRDFDDGGLETRPDLYVRLHHPESDRVLYSTEDVVRGDAGRIEDFLVHLSHWSFNISDGPMFLRFRPQLHGRVTGAADEPLSGLVVSAYDREDGRLLAESVTDEEGLYSCWYSEPAGERTLEVKVASSGGQALYQSRQVLWFDGSTPVVHQVKLRSAG